MEKGFRNVYITEHGSLSAEKGRKERMQKSFLVVLVAFLFLLVSLSIVSADVNHGWDWHKVDGNEKTEITYCYDASVNSTWQEWIEEAVKEWNDTGTGWVFKKVTGCTGQVVIKVENIGSRWWNATAHKYVYDNPWAVTDYGPKDTDGRITKRTITFDEDPTKLADGTEDPGDGEWGTEGADTMDPRYVAKHELGHCLRLKDVKDPGKKDDVMWYAGAVGEHPRSLTANDTAEATDSIKGSNRGLAMLNGIITSEGGVLVYTDPTVTPGGIKAQVTIPAGALTESTNLTLTVLYDAVPVPNNVE